MPVPRLPTISKRLKGEKRHGSKGKNTPVFPPAKCRSFSTSSATSRLTSPSRLYTTPPKAACEYLEKLLKSAAANAENNYDMDRNSLYVSECFVCPGPILKRIRPRAQGRAFRIDQENQPHHPCAQGKRVIEEEVNYGTEDQPPWPACRRNQRLGFPLVCEGQRVRRHHCLRL